MRTRILYALARGADVDALEVAVHNLVDDGYEPHGSPVVIIHGDDWYGYQAMVRRLTEEEWEKENTG